MDNTKKMSYKKKQWRPKSKKIIQYVKYNSELEKRAVWSVVSNTAYVLVADSYCKLF
jgi:hypothetical protein